MKLNRILCPIDYSPFCRAANFYASLFADECGAAVIFLNVGEPSAGKSDVEATLDDLYAELSTTMRPFIHDVRHSFEVRFGDPAKEILKLSSERNVDLIVMGTHGRTGANHLLHGSVCEKVLREAGCPVMAVKSALNVDWVLADAGGKAGLAG